ncbi:MAG: hypothetical protein ACRCYU_07840 [Nocardioides sp.]
MTFCFRVVSLWLAALLLLPVAAHAERYIHEDPAGDLVDFGPEVVVDEEEEEEFPVAPEVRTGDVTRFVVTHKPRSLEIRVRMRDLHRRSDQVQAISLSIRVPKRRSYLVDSLVRPNRPKRLGLRTISPRGLTRQPCAGLRLTRQWSKSRVVVTVPRSCLDRPAWVRVGATVITGTRRQPYMDNPLAGPRGVFSLRVTPRLRSGVRG